MSPLNLRHGTSAPQQPATVPACFETIPTDILHTEVLPKIASNGDLLRVSQINSHFRMNALTFSQHTVNRLHTASIQSIVDRQRGQTTHPPCAHDFRQLAACNDLLSKTLGAPPELARDELFRWEVDASAGDAQMLGDMRNTSDALLYSAKNRKPKLTLSQQGCWGVPKGIVKLTHVREIDLSHSGYHLGSLGPASSMSQLTHLYINNSDFWNLEGVEKLQNLIVLDASSNLSLNDLDHLRGHPSLQVLRLANTPVDDLTPLVDILTLRQLTIPNAVIIPDGLVRPELVITRSDA